MNVSSTQLGQKTAEPSEKFFAVVFALLAVLILLGTIMSLLVIVSTYMYKSLQTVANILAGNSCASGLFYFVFHTVYIILAIRPPPNYRQNSVLCQFVGYMYSVTCCGISWSHAVLAWNRLCYALLPRQRWLLTYTFARRIIALHWTLTFGLPLPIVFFHGYQYQRESRICILTTRQTSTSLTGVILFYNIPFTGVLTAYLLVWRHARHANNMAITRATRDLAVMRHILTLVLIGIVCGHPYMTLILLDYLGIATSEWYLLVSFFITFSVTANMFAIFSFNQKLRKLLLAKCITLETSQSSTSNATNLMLPLRQIAQSESSANPTSPGPRTFSFL